jgi:glucose uptake protein GlcU
MNFAPFVPQPLAVCMALLAASMWGTWFISLKHLGDYPLDGFYMTLFTTSLIFVWTLGLIIDGTAIFTNIRELWDLKKLKIIIILLGGVAYVIGMHLSLKVMTMIGLTLSQPLQSSVGFVVGTLITVGIGGRPAGLTYGRIILSVCFLLSAVFLVFFAEKTKSASQRKKNIDTGLPTGKGVMRKALLLIALASAFAPGYTLALSYGLKTITQPVGLAVLPFMCVLCTGAFTGSLLTSGIRLTRRGEWHKVWEAPFRLHKFGIVSGLFHYGGNVIHTFATGALSSAISWPLGLTSNLWTQLWGIRYGEFKGAPKRAYILQFCSFACYVLGAFIIVSGR